ncbi:Uncharacterised protein [Yersinia kristensenii]|nr:Uncharacterised protein [Yersinia kristensenii]
MKKTITTLERVKVNGVIKERKATHIVTGAHGYETLCTKGYNLSKNENDEVIEDCLLIAENQLPVTCTTCYIVWHDVNGFNRNDFNTEIEESKFANTNLSEIEFIKISELYNS